MKPRLLRYAIFYKQVGSAKDDPYEVYICSAENVEHAKEQFADGASWGAFGEVEIQFIAKEFIE